MINNRDKQQRLILLGSGEVAQYEVGNKATLLDKALKAGLPVPRGIVILDSAYREALKRGLLVRREQIISALDPDELVDFLGIPRFELPVAVRSAFSAEDRAEESLAGFFTSNLGVNAMNPVTLTGALCAVWTSALNREGDFRRDVLIMEMVKAEHAGVAFTEREYEDDLVNYTSGTADQLVSGKVAGENVNLPKLRRWEDQRGTDNLPVFLPRLQVLLRNIRSVFGQDDWDIEWADNGRKCWLVQVRPVTRLTQRNDAFTVANLKEIFPEVPSRFMMSMIEDCGAALFAYSSFDREIPSQRPFIEAFYGRPYINLSILADTMRVLGLPTSMVTDNIGGEAGQISGIDFRRMLAKIVSLTLPKFAFAQLLSPFTAHRAGLQMIERSKESIASLSDGAERLSWTYTQVVRSAMILATAIGPALSLVKLTGTLEAHSARLNTIATQIYGDLKPLLQLLNRRADLRADVEQGHIPDDPEFRVLWDAYMQKHGHRGIYESDVARPRYHEDPSPIIGILASPFPQRNGERTRSWREWLTLPVWWHASRTMKARELQRYRSMKAFDNIRRQMLPIIDDYVVSGALRSPDDFWMLDVDEVRHMEQGWMPDSVFWVAREAEIDSLKAYDLPDLIYRYDDLEQFRDGYTGDESQTRFSGIGLTKGEVRGRAWVLDEPEMTLPESFVAEDTILIARSIDAGWISTFAKVAGVIVETGGDLSHGSIILREIGLPAVTNVNGVARVIQTGDQIVLRASNGTVERIPATKSEAIQS